MWPENPRKLRESSAKDPRKPWLAAMAPPIWWGSGSAHWDLALVVSGCAHWDPRSQLGSGSAHWNLALAVEVWQCPLRSGARGWGWGGGRGGEGGGGHQMQYRSRCCHSDNWGKKTMSVVLGIKGFKTHFTTENGELLSHVFRESSRKCISDTWMPRKKNPASRKVRERDGEREDRIEHKVTGFWQPLIYAVTNRINRGCTMLKTCVLDRWNMMKLHVDYFLLFSPRFL